ncbi:hypothetical protein [Thiocystis violacea]|uniref:hypothetical protein n=1 Tax=Thiocystis violacea TaxID=13725 RepID=UPI0019032BCA|nr:hypothetical protein [Thiocystis violacea]
MHHQQRLDLTIALTLLGLSLGAQAESNPPVYELGTINVTASAPDLGAMGTDQVASGVTVSANSRNEKTVFVSGFDSRQGPLFIDVKGLSSVADGPNALGGAINLISRKPTRALEGDVSLGVGDGQERTASANADDALADGYPAAGRTWMLNARYEF